MWAGAMPSDFTRDSSVADAEYTRFTLIRDKLHGGGNSETGAVHWVTQMYRPFILKALPVSFGPRVAWACNLRSRISRACARERGPTGTPCKGHVQLLSIMRRKCKDSRETRNCIAKTLSLVREAWTERRTTEICSQFFNRMRLLMERLTSGTTKN